MVIIVLAVGEVRMVAVIIVTPIILVVVVVVVKEEEITIATIATTTTIIIIIITERITDMVEEIIIITTTTNEEENEATVTMTAVQVHKEDLVAVTIIIMNVVTIIERGEEEEIEGIAETEAAISDIHSTAVVIEIVDDRKSKYCYFLFFFNAP